MKNWERISLEIVEKTKKENQLKQEIQEFLSKVVVEHSKKTDGLFVFNLRNERYMLERSSFQYGADETIMIHRWCSLRFSWVQVSILQEIQKVYNFLSAPQKQEELNS